MTGMTTSGMSDDVSKLRHDLSNALCAARLMSELYDAMVLKYEARIKELEESIKTKPPVTGRA